MGARRHTMWLRVDMKGIIAEGALVDTNGDVMVLRHLGGLAPGHSKSVPPWC